MKFPFHRVSSYLNYWLNAVGEHSLQGPFVYDLYKKVINNRADYDYTHIEQIREQFIKSDNTLSLDGIGAGSSYLKSNERSVSDIAKKGVISPKYGALLHRLVSYTESKNILELGTSLGISTLYLSENDEANITTIEGESALANIAVSVFEGLERQNITVLTAKIENALPGFIQQSKPLDMVFFDANHTEEATLDYFSQCLKRAHDKSCFVFDDIHWSKGMENAWTKIHQHFEVTLSIDLYQMGIIFFNPEIRKQHFILEF